MKFPFVIQCFTRVKEQDFSQAVTEVVVYDELEQNNIIKIFDDSRHWIRTRKPKLKELDRFNWLEKLSYVLPFKTQLSDLIVDALKFLSGIGLGYLINQIT